ncbi:hypothetical protein EV283_1024 [Sphingomonas sp. BK036]|uniref:hypothetical protein n=1 Tax=Sphingomonas sp. BK036 TaxID=2512122 RepID=UPI001029E6BA|nr:hypothetical protein [Sphingomonas sp. BK036]RZT56967.1 hypothetical protein EV283_1024 [Sphingomonas sp. BK036]
MQHDLRLRAAARAIYDNVYPAVDPAPFSFEEAERFGTVEYRQAVGAAQDARSALAAQDDQLLFAAIL